MTTDVMHMTHTQVAELRQLVLFPEIFGYRSVPLDQCRQAETARDDEPGGHQRSIQAALSAGQLPLFPLD